MAASYRPPVYTLQDARAMKFGLFTDKAPSSLLKYRDKLVTMSQTVLF